MLVEHELTVLGGLGHAVAEAFSKLPDLMVDNLKRRDVLQLPETAMVVLCSGDLIESAWVHCTQNDGYRLIYLNNHTERSTILMSSVTGSLRVQSKACRLFYSASAWAEDATVRNHAFDVAMAHSRAMSNKVRSFSFANCKHRLAYLRDVMGLDLSQWSKQDIARWAGMSREIISRAVTDGKINV